MQASQSVQFQLEPFQHVIDEMMPLLEKHWREISANLDIPLDVDRYAYQRLQDIGMLRLYTARLEGKLIGYSVYFLKHNLHYKSSFQALQDVLFIDPDFRKGSLGARLIKHCDDMLKADGVQVVYHHVKAKHNFGKLLERMGYELVDLIFQKRLD